MSVPAGKGFSLVELIVAVAIIAILLGLALPSYYDSVQKSRRSDAQKTLIEFAGSAARIRTETSSYASVTAPASSDYYTFAFSGTPDATTFTLVATPKGAQASDLCGTMAITHTGARTTSSTDTQCWK